MHKIERAVAAGAGDPEAATDVIPVKAGPRKKATRRARRVRGPADRGRPEHRVTKLLYYSVHSNREKDYELHPYNLAYADGGLYLTAYVPRYHQVRVFAVERIRRLTVLERGFTPVEDLTTEAFGHSLGVNRGQKPERIVIEFSRLAASSSASALASLPEARAAARRRHPPDAEGVPRLGAAHLGAGRGSHARVVAPVGAGRRDPASSSRKHGKATRRSWCSTRRCCSTARRRSEVAAAELTYA